MNLVPLGELVEIKGGGTPDKSVAAYWDGDIPWASVKDFKSTEISQTTDRITELGVQSSATNIIPAGSILVPTRMAVGKAAINTVDLAINQDLKALKVGARADTRYLLHALLAQASVLERQATGATVQGITLDVLRRLQIPLPPLDEQRRIAAILDQADTLRRKRRESLAHLESLKVSIFRQIFGDQRSNSKLLPKAPLGELIKVSSGKGLIGSDQRGGLYPVYGGNGINGWHDDFMVRAGTIVIGRVGVYCGAVHLTDRDAWVTDNALVVTKKVKNLRTTYLAAALLMADLNQYAGRSAQPLISGGRIYPIEIGVPSDENQLLFEEALGAYKAIEAMASNQSSDFDALFASLQHRAFSGQL